MQAAASYAGPTRRDHGRYDYYVLQLDPSTRPQRVATHLGFEYQGQLSHLKDHYVFRAARADHDVVQWSLQQRRRARRQLDDHHVLDGILLAQKQKLRRRLEKRVIPPPPDGAISARAVDTPIAAAVQQQAQLMKDLKISDPIFTEQWHLYNTVQIGHDVNVTDSWLMGVTGKNTTVAIIDDGIDMFSNDLKDNYFAAGSYDFNDDNPEPKPRLSDDRHGTRCAGEVAAVRNNVCGIGVAYDARVAGIRILSKPISDADEALAMMYNYHENQIYSCSWGPRDDGRSMEAPGILIQRAMLQAIQQGRGGLGSIYVFASGNGAASDDNCNFDGYTNSIYSITVGAVDRAGKHPYYSENCSAQLVVTYSSGSGDYIHTTDVGTDQCATGHGGTSAAAPLAAGIFALVLSVRDDLTWRDLQYLAIDTAVVIQDKDLKDSDWQTTNNGRQFSHVFGYGKIDSYTLIEKAKVWEKVKPQAWFFSPVLQVNKDIPEGSGGLAAHFDITADLLKQANLGRLEHVTITMNVNHTRRGDLSVDLISPANVVSHIATARKNDAYAGGYDDWTFMSVAHWGESGIGKWTLIVRDTLPSNGHNGTFADWHLKLWGESIEAEKAMPLPLPNVSSTATMSTVTGPATTAIGTISLPTTETTVTTPTDHPERPTKPGFQPTTTLGPSPTSTSATSVPPPTSPMLGPIWIYVALCLIVVFCAGLGSYLWIARRRRLKNKVRDSYEFELIDGEEMEGLAGGEKGVAGGRKQPRRTRGGELYDAFAGGSDDDDEMDEYRDRSAERLAGVDEADQYIVGEESDDGHGESDDDDDESGGGGGVDEKAESKLLGDSRDRP